MEERTLEQQRSIPEFDFRGIKRIEIPKVDTDFAGEDFGFSILKKYLPMIMNTHKENAEKIDFLYNYYLGKQDILQKQRLYEKDSKNNHRVVENHASKQVNFKTAFITGEQRDYTHKSDSNSDDLIYLDRYFTDCGFFGKDKDLKEWVFATGIGVTYIAPRTDIIIVEKGEARYANPDEGFDINYNAPFKFNVVDPRSNFVVYSSGFEKEPLFCVSVVDVDLSTDNEPNPKPGKELHIETRYASYVVRSDIGYISFQWNWLNGEISRVNKSLRYLPLIEHSSNNQRLSLVENNRTMFNLINTLRSSIADMIVDNANAILVFKNTDVDADTVIAMREAGAIIISDKLDSKTNSSADLDTITIEIPFDGLNEFSDRIMENCYDIAGVPLGSGQVTSGGDTGQARLLNGGWTNAYEMAQSDIRAFLRSDYEVLKTILMLCKLVPNCPLNELYASQIDIKYRINQTDNFMARAQGIRYLYDINMPLDEIAKVSGMFTDITTLTQKWSARDAELRRAATERSESIGNNSQE